MEYITSGISTPVSPSSVLSALSFIVPPLHEHTAAPLLNSPWCVYCDALLTWVTEDEEEGL